MSKQKKTVLVLAIITVFIATGFFLPKLIGAPRGPTMKTLDQIPPTWSQKLDASERFELVLDGEAVLDKETGLVWEKSPDATPRTWCNACTHCYQHVVGGRKGWRLPTVEELASLVDPNVSDPALPSGHPFSGARSADYWSSTTDASSSSFAWRVDFSKGHVINVVKSFYSYVWCVRGGHGYDGY